jgi:YVTN family beta-propeller protein
LRLPTTARTAAGPPRRPRALVPFAIAALLLPQLAAADTWTAGSPAFVDFGPNIDRPHGVAVDFTSNYPGSNGKGMVYVALRDTNQLAVINGDTDAIVTHVGVDVRPYGVAVNPGAAAGPIAGLSVVGPHRVYVANGLSHTVSVIDPSTNSLVATLTQGLSQPYAVAVGWALGKVYVSSPGSNSVEVFGPNNAHLASIPLGTTPGIGSKSIAVQQQTTRVFVANPVSNKITVIDGATNMPDVLLPSISTSGPTDVATDLASTRVWVTSLSNNNVKVYDVVGSTATLVATLSVPGPQGIDVDHLGRRVYVTSSGPSQVFDADTYASLASLPSSTGHGSYDIAANPLTCKTYATIWDGLRADVWKRLPCTVPQVAKDLTLSSYGTCAITLAGNADCYGHNGFGQSTDRNNLDVVAAGAGTWHTCFVLTTGNVACQGPSGGPFDRGQSTGYTGPTPAVQASGGLWHTCALLVTGSAQCWGANDNGEGNGYSSISNGGIVATAVAAGAWHTCYLLASGNVQCMGYALYGAEAPYAGGDAIAIDAGAAHNCVVTTAHDVFCWGWDGNINGPPPTGQTNPYNGHDAIAVAAGRLHTCALLTTGNVLCWGDNSFGQTMGYGGGDAVDVESNYDHTCVRTAVGQLRCWGRNDSGQAAPWG